MNKKALQIIILTFYRFFDNPNYQEIRIPLREYSKSINIEGIIIMAKEGLNATISGSRENTDKFFKYIKKEYNFTFDNIKETYLDYQPFRKMKVKAKNEIVTLGMPTITGKDRGQYIKAKDWDNFTSQDDVVIIDTRNYYEISLGTFKGAINPNTENFGDFPRWFKQNKEKFKNKKIAMYCTGGVRCEKSTAYLKSLGLKDVYHLEGGIIQYLQDKGEQSETWLGDCFVFDHRLAIDKECKQVKATTCLTRT